MAYFIKYRPVALRQLEKLETKIQARLKPKIKRLSENPRPYGHIKLKGFENRYRLRVGDYRVIYEIHDDMLLVLIVKVGPRRDIYD
ncbi:MAG: type II toxin-antitoxin system RelE/ParE family toxin [Thiomargarita sp.]|nr:type II toxin-antitoxin system RelE/ParE family toxin [Thiomargarita sp.]